MVLAMQEFSRTVCVRFIPYEWLIKPLVLWNNSDPRICKYVMWLIYQEAHTLLRKSSSICCWQKAENDEDCTYSGGDFIGFAVDLFKCIDKHMLADMAAQFQSACLFAINKYRQADTQTWVACRSRSHSLLSPSSSVCIHMQIFGNRVSGRANPFPRCDRKPLRRTRERCLPMSCDL